MVSPNCAVLSAVCRLPPAGTRMLVPDIDGYEVSINVRGSAGSTCASAEETTQIEARTAVAAIKSRWDRFCLSLIIVPANLLLARISYRTGPKASWKNANSRPTCLGFRNGGGRCQTNQDRNSGQT